MKTSIMIRSCLVFLLFALTTGPAAWSQPVRVETIPLDATLNAWGGMVLGPDGNLYLTDASNNHPGPNSGFALDLGSEVFRIDLAPDENGAMTGKVELFFVSGQAGPWDLAFQADSNVVVGTINEGNTFVEQYDFQGSLLRRIPQSGPIAFALSPDGRIYLSTCDQINVLSLFNSIGDFISELGFCPMSMAFDDPGNLYFINEDGDLYSVAVGGNTPVLLTNLAGAVGGSGGYLTSANGMVYATTYRSSHIYQITPDGVVSVLAGSGQSVPGLVDGEGPEARFDRLGGIAASVTGDTLFVVQVADVNSPGLQPTAIRMITGVQTAQTSPVAAEQNTGVPADFMLEQNYPNPFNPGTRIRFTLEATQPVTLTIYDLYGREVTTLFDGFKAAGTHEVQFDATGLPSGSYIYRLKAGSAIATRHMTLLR